MEPPTLILSRTKTILCLSLSLSLSLSLCMSISMSLDPGTFESLVPARFITFTFPNPTHSNNSTTQHPHLHTPLLRVAVLDSPIQPTTTDLPRVAAMIVPARRETDWIFITEAGHLQLLLSSPQISRLILIGNLPVDPPQTAFNRPISINPNFREAFEENLSPLLVALSPKLGLKKGLPEIPFLCYEDDVIRSVIVERCVGSCVGEMVVEDVELESFDDREFRRRLRFKRMPNLIQTQVRIFPISSSECSEFNGISNSVGLGEIEFQLDKGVLVHPYLTPMVASLSLISLYLEEKIQGGFKPKALCLGVGGGALLAFLKTQLDFRIVGVEADEVVLRVAKKHFGLEAGEFLRIYIEDGLELLKKLSRQPQKQNCDSLNDLCEKNGCYNDSVFGFDDKFDVIMVDLDSSDARMGVIAPPPEFVTKSVLLAAKEVLCEFGILVVNVIPPTKSFYDGLIHEFRDVFQELYEIDVGNGENFVLIAAVEPIKAASEECKDSFFKKLKLVISGAYIDSIRRI